MLNGKRNRRIFSENVYEQIYESVFFNSTVTASQDHGAYNTENTNSHQEINNLDVHPINNEQDIESDLSSQDITSDYSYQDSVISYEESTDLTNRQPDQDDSTQDLAHGVQLLIAKTFQEVNLCESTQRKIYDLINIISRSVNYLPKFCKFKSLMNDLSPFSVYIMKYCHEHGDFCQDASKPCCPNSAVGELTIFSLTDTIRLILEQNLSILTSNNQTEFCKTLAYTDLWQDLASNTDVIKITLIINMDDAQMVKSSKVCTTPVPFTVAELPRYLRLKRDNVFNLAVYHGPKNFPVELLWRHSLIEPLLALGILLDEPQHYHNSTKVYSDKPIKIDTRFGSFNIMLRVGPVIMDSVAKPKSLNIKSFMGYYGCPYCLIKGELITDGSKRYFVYPYDLDSFFPRKDHDFYLKASEKAMELNQNYLGVNGCSILSRIVKVPDMIPIDYMHSILEGCFKHLMGLTPFNTQTVRREIDKLVSQICLPHDFSRKFRKLSDIAYWKGSECRTFLFLLVILFKDRVDDDSFMLLLCLANLTKVFCQDHLSIQELAESEQLLDCFLVAFQEIHGKERMRFNIHLLTHIPFQYKWMGSLTDVSAFVFENNIFSLKRSFHGTRGQLSQMSVNYALNKGISARNNDLNYWVSMIDPDNSLKLKVKSNNFLPDKILGEFDVKFMISSRVTRLLRNRNINLESVKVFHKFKLNHVIYHTCNYRFKRNSCSFIVSYQEHGENNSIGKIAGFLAINSKQCTFAVDKILAIIYPFQVYPTKFVTQKLTLENLKLKQIKNLPIFKSQNYLKCKPTGEQEILIEANKILTRVVLVRDASEPGIYWASFADVPFEHD